MLKEFDCKFYSDGVNNLVGVDEVGRGPLAGPVVAAAVIFDEKIVIDGINDSKKITERKREQIVEIIKSEAKDYAYGIVNHNTIDEINILQATLRAMKMAVESLSLSPDLIIIDGNKSFVSNFKTKTIIKGDSKSFSIAAASILAKVKRDKIMKDLSKQFPEYAWERNKGYGTKEHIAAIKEFGSTKYHRQSFLKKILSS